MSTDTKTISARAYLQQLGDAAQILLELGLDAFSTDGDLRIVARHEVANPMTQDGESLDYDDMLDFLMVCRSEALDDLRDE